MVTRAAAIRPASAGSNPDAHKLALRLLAQSFDGQDLKDPARRAEALADLIRIAPDDHGPPAPPAPTFALLPVLTGSSAQALLVGMF